MQVGGKKGSTTYIGNLNLCGGSFFGCVLLQQPPSKINDKCPQLTTDMQTLYGNSSIGKGRPVFSVRQSFIIVSTGEILYLLFFVTINKRRTIKYLPIFLLKGMHSLFLNQGLLVLTNPPIKATFFHKWQLGPIVNDVKLILLNVHNLL